MTAEELQRVLIRSWRFIVVCMILAGAGAYIGTRFVTPLYASTVQMGVEISTSNVSVVVTLVADEYINTDAQLATSTPVLARVVPAYPGLSAGQLRAKVTASPISNTRLLSIRVLDPSPTRAASLANDIANALIADQQASQEQQQAASQQPILQRIQSYQQKIASLTESLQALAPTAANQSQIASLQSQLTQANQTYSDWQATLERTVEAESVSTVALTITEPAQPAQSPAEPRVTINLAAGVLFGLLLALFLIVLRFWFDQRTPRIDTLAKLLEAPVLAEISQHPRERADATRQTNPSEAADAYSQLRRALTLLNVDTPKRTLVIAGVQASDGSSAIAADLALYLAQQGNKTLLVDANLDHPSQAQRFGIEQGSGITEAVVAFSEASRASRQQSLKPYLHTVPGVGVAKLTIMPAGEPPPDATAVMKSQTMGQLLRMLLADTYETVIFDAPPVLTSLDARILAANMGGVVLVIKPLRTHTRHITHAMALLHAAQVRVLGGVFVDRASVQPIADAHEDDRVDEYMVEHLDQTSAVSMTNASAAADSRARGGRSHG